MCEKPCIIEKNQNKSNPKVVQQEAENANGKFPLETSNMETTHISKRPVRSTVKVKKKKMILWQSRLNDENFDWWGDDQISAMRNK